MSSKRTRDTRIQRGKFICRLWCLSRIGYYLISGKGKILIRIHKGEDKNHKMFILGTFSVKNGGY